MTHSTVARVRAKRICCLALVGPGLEGLGPRQSGDVSLMPLFSRFFNVSLTLKQAMGSQILYCNPITKFVLKPFARSISPPYILTQIT